MAGLDVTGTAIRGMDESEDPEPAVSRGGDTGGSSDACPLGFVLNNRWQVLEGTVPLASVSRREKGLHIWLLVKSG